MECSIRVTTFPRPEIWPPAAAGFLVIVVVVVGVHLGHLPPDWIMSVLAAVLATGPAALPEGPAPETRRPSWA